MVGGVEGMEIQRFERLRSLQQRFDPAKFHAPGHRKAYLHFCLPLPNAIRPSPHLAAITL
jgi:hypothetical protein